VSVRASPVTLCYHAVSDTWEHLLSVSPASFERQLRLMLALRYRPGRAAEIAGGRGRLFHVTFDDAFRSVRNAMPALERLGVPATIFLCTAFADDGRPPDVPELEDQARAHPDELATLNWDAITELAARGFEVGSHTTTHAHLTALSDAELSTELRTSREQIEDVLRGPCRFLSFPYGEHDERVRDAARDAGYEAAFALPGRRAPWEVFALPRVGIWRQTGLFRTAVKMSPINRTVAVVRGWQ
jgi:peptidoglycan/xylan/chitin deacetylase (PgdA/CDA1 family)